MSRVTKTKWLMLEGAFRAGHTLGREIAPADAGTVLKDSLERAKAR